MAFTEPSTTYVSGSFTPSHSCSPNVVHVFAALLKLLNKSRVLLIALLLTACFFVVWPHCDNGCSEGLFLTVERSIWKSESDGLPALSIASVSQYQENAAREHVLLNKLSPIMCNKLIFHNKTANCQRLLHVSLIKKGPAGSPYATVGVRILSARFLRFCVGETYTSYKKRTSSLNFSFSCSRQL